MDVPTALHTADFPVDALVYFLLSLPCMAFSAVSSRLLSNFGLIRARRALEAGQKGFEPFVRDADGYSITLALLEMLSVVGMMYFGQAVLSGYLPVWGVWAILGALYLVFDLLSVRFVSRMDEHRLAERLIRFIRPLVVLLKPLTYGLGLILRSFSRSVDAHFANADRIEAELELMLEESKKQGGLEDFKGRIMRSAIDFGDTTVREVMIPRTDLTSCSVETTLQEAFNICVSEGYSRLPVYEGDLDTIVGVLYYKDLMQRLFDLEAQPQEKSRQTIGELVREAYFVPETNHINALFEDFQRDHIHMAIVVDEFGGTAGIVTLEDIIEEFFGEIQDEYDSEESGIVPLDVDKARVMVDAKTNISEVSDLFGVDLEEDEGFDTVGGLVMYALGRVGAVGDEVTLGGLRFVVRDASERCILHVEVSRAEEALTEAKS